MKIPLTILGGIAAAAMSAGGYLFAEVSRLEGELAEVRVLAKNADNDDILRQVQITQARVDERLKQLEAKCNG